MAVVFRVLQCLDRQVGGNDFALLGCRLLGSFKVHIHPVQTFCILHLSGYRLDTCRDANAAAYGDEENVAGIFVGNARLPYTHRHNRNTLRVQAVIDTDVFLHPVDDQLRIGFGFPDQIGIDIGGEELPVRCQEFVSHARIEDIFGEQGALYRLGIVQMVCQYGGRRVAQVLGGDGVQQVHRHRAFTGGRLAEELLDLAPVAPAADHEVGGLQRIDA